jgi:hypothetical protein
MFPEFPPATRFPRSAHPGTVTFVGPDGTQRTENAANLPDWLKFVPDAGGSPVPVVRVVRVANNGSHSLRSYGPDGRLLWVGVMVPQAVEPVRTRTGTDRPAAQPATGWF